MVDPKQGIIFGLVILAIQQLDGNIIGPKILGNSTGLSAFWVVFAILLGGGLFGFLGMVFGVPSFAVIYYLVKRTAEYLLRKRNLPVNTDIYHEAVALQGFPEDDGENPPEPEDMQTKSEEDIHEDVQ